MRKLTAFMLALFMLFTICPLTVSAQNVPREIEWQSQSGFFVGKSSSVPDDNCIQFDNISESISFKVGRCVYCNGAYPRKRKRRPGGLLQLQQRHTRKQVVSFE